MLDINYSSDFKRVGDSVDTGYYDITLFNDPTNCEVKGVVAMDQAIENYLLTIPGERLFNIDFGSNIYDMLFEKNSNTSELRESIYSDLESKLNIVLDRSTADIGNTTDPHVMLITFKYSTNDGIITNHEFTRRFSK